MEEEGPLNLTNLSIELLHNIISFGDQTITTLRHVCKKFNEAVEIILCKRIKWQVRRVEFHISNACAALSEDAELQFLEKMKSTVGSLHLRKYCDAQTKEIKSLLTTWLEEQKIHIYDEVVQNDAMECNEMHVIKFPDQDAYNVFKREVRRIENYIQVINYEKSSNNDHGDLILVTLSDYILTLPDKDQIHIETRIKYDDVLESLMSLKLTFTRNNNHIESTIHFWRDTESCLTLVGNIDTKFYTLCQDLGTSLCPALILEMFVFLCTSVMDTEIIPEEEMEICDQIALHLKNDGKWSCVDVDGSIRLLTDLEEEMMDD